MALSKEQVARYSRQLILPEIGVRGQERLLSSSALLIGAGGLGSPAALYLAAAGVGRLGIVDPEAVAPSNLHRQVLHDTRGIGRPKVQSAHERLTALNPDVSVRAYQERLTAANALELVGGYDVVLDGSDNFPTRYLVNDACVLSGRPLVHGGAIHLRGQVLTIRPRVSACMRCVFPEPPRPGDIPSCQDAGVAGTAVGVIGSLMAHEALKLLLGIGEPLTDRLLIFDGLRGRMREAAVRRDVRCAVCGESPTIRTPQGSVDEVWCDTVSRSA
jgi:molybdopterin-synthase adenylyltransferase